MKKDIHPQLYKDCVVTCACGNKFTTISTLPSITVEICGACHPFYTGQKRFVDTERRIDKFQKKMELAQEKMKKAQEAKKAKLAKKSDRSGQKAPSLKEMLGKVKTNETTKVETTQENK